MTARLWCAAAAAWCAAASCHAVQAADAPAERARIAAERAEVEQAFFARERECRARFLVNACLDAAGRERRRALGHLRQQEMLLDEARRKERAAQRIQSIRGKVSRDDARRRGAGRLSGAASAPVPGG